MCALKIDKEKKRKEILLAALSEFSEKGFSKATIQNIADKAGIGKGTIYEYFKNKNEIIDSSFRYFQKDLEVDLETLLLSKENGFGKLKNIISIVLKQLKPGNSENMHLMFDFWAEGIKGGGKGLMLNEMNKLYYLYRSLLTDVLKEGIEDGSIKKNIEPFEISSILIGMLDGVMVQWILNESMMNVEKIEKSMINLILEGVGTRSKNKEESK